MEYQFFIFFIFWILLKYFWLIITRFIFTSFLLRVSNAVSIFYLFENCFFLEENDVFQENNFLKVYELEVLKSWNLLKYFFENDARK